MLKSEFNLKSVVLNQYITDYTEMNKVNCLEKGTNKSKVMFVVST